MDADTREGLSTYGAGGALMAVGFVVLRTSSTIESWTLMFTAVGMLLLGMVRLFGRDDMMRRR